MQLVSGRQIIIIAPRAASIACCFVSPGKQTASSQQTKLSLTPQERRSAVVIGGEDARAAAVRSGAPGMIISSGH
jgi:hypothetical protein